MSDKKTGSLRMTIHKRPKVVVLIVLFLCMAFGCFRPIKPKSDYITVELGDLIITRYFDIMDKVEFEGDETIRLSDFVDSTITDYPEIYAYRIIGTDGFYAALKGSPDNIWEHMQKGYLRLSDGKATFEASLGLMGRYYVKDVASIRLLRKIDTIIEDGKDSTFLIIDKEVDTYLDSTDVFYNGRPGIKLSEFVEPLTSTPEYYIYTLISSREEEQTFSWVEIQTGWWLLDMDLTKFYPDLGASSRMPYLLSIELTLKSE